MFEEIYEFVAFASFFPLIHIESRKISNIFAEQCVFAINFQNKFITIRIRIIYKEIVYSL